MLNEIWEATRQIPQALDRRPILADRWTEPYKVWAELSGSRNYTAGGAAGIPFSEFFLWAVAFRYSREELEYMWEDVHHIDVVWLSETTKRAKAEIAQKQAQAKTEPKLR